jgi:hypothetical protein
MKDYSRLLTDEILIGKGIDKNLTIEETRVLKLLYISAWGMETEVVTNWASINFDLVSLVNGDIFLILDSLEQKNLIKYNEQENKIYLHLIN